MAGRIRVRLTKSSIGRKPAHRKTIKALGLKKINSTIEHEATPSILGMVKSVEFMVSVEELK